MTGIAVLRQQRANLFLEKLGILRVLGIARGQPGERMEGEEQKSKRHWKAGFMHHRLLNRSRSRQTQDYKYRHVRKRLGTCRSNRSFRHLHRASSLGEVLANTLRADPLRRGDQAVARLSFGRCKRFELRANGRSERFLQPSPLQ